MKHHAFKVALSLSNTGTPNVQKMYMTVQTQLNPNILIAQILFKWKAMWLLIGSAPDFCGRSPVFESSVSHNDPDALQDHSELM